VSSQAIILLSSVRRSIFRVEMDKTIFLGQIMAAIREVLQGRIGLTHLENYHEFCRLLGRLKSNYQLSELMRTDNFSEWSASSLLHASLPFGPHQVVLSCRLELATNFSISSFEQWQWSLNSMHYILQLWSRLVAAVPYVHAEASGTQVRALPHQHHLRHSVCVCVCVFALERDRATGNVHPTGAPSLHIGDDPFCSACRDGRHLGGSTRQ
jgi:hypothetical protein